MPKHNFYPRSPCGERRKPKDLKSRRIVFLSTLSLRRATFGFCDLEPIRNNISIHALLAESDTIMNNIIFVPGEFLSTLSLRRATAPSQHPCPRSRNFYPRSPCGERRLQLFLYYQDNRISIHALLAESDRNADCNCHSVRPISIHALLAESDTGAGVGLYLVTISIHALLAESDRTQSASLSA